MGAAFEYSTPRRGGRWLAALLAGALLALGSTGCISTWRGLPESPPPPAAKAHGTLYYHVDGETGLFGGGAALRDTFREIAPFAQLEPRDEPPAKGLFCRVDYERRSPNVASGILAYVSYAFLFAIPFWGTDGYLIRYHVYADGQEKKVFEYEIKRKSFGWIAALPFVWVNLLTPSETDAFSSTAYAFFLDAKPLFDVEAKRLARAGR
jgi:hypothetical protein